MLICLECSRDCERWAQRVHLYAICMSAWVAKFYRGDGVLGEQPELGTGEEHIYSSYVPIRTPSGRMVGSFQMQVLIKPYVLQALTGSQITAIQSLKQATAIT